MRDKSPIPLCLAPSLDERNRQAAVASPGIEQTDNLREGPLELIRHEVCDIFWREELSELCLTWCYRRARPHRCCREHVPIPLKCSRLLHVDNSITPLIVTLPSSVAIYEWPHRSKRDCGIAGLAPDDSGSDSTTIGEPRLRPTALDFLILLPLVVARFVGQKQCHPPPVALDGGLFKEFNALV